MKEVVGFISENWGTITLVSLVLIQVFNAATRHWKDHTGVVRVLTFISEALSIITSKGQTNGSLGKVKAPFTSVRNEDCCKQEEKDKECIQ